MNGDIKLATLSDTDDTDVTGSELVTNGTFDSDTSGWTVDNGSAVSTSGQAVVTSAGAGNVVLRQDIPTVVGKSYVLSADFVAGASAFLSIAGSTQITMSTAGDNYNLTFVATSTATRIQLYWSASASGETRTYDSASFKLADADRSVNANGLIINGTVTRSPVATGADLVAYSGWSYEGNYLQQPYTGDLDFGTGDLSIMGWYKASGGGYHPIAVYNINDTANSGWGFRYSYSASRWEFKIGASYASYTDTRPQSQTWGLFALVRRSGVVSIYWNAELIGSLSQANDGSLSGAELHIGEGSNYPSFIGAGNFVNGSLALLRISATAPTAEQISRIYNDEKALFQENAQATLYGTSDAVTALAHDDVTNLLHVGTSAGRSVFQGLRRVENTTAAVGTAISASNGMVVEE